MECRQKFINCADSDWEKALHSCLYKGIEAVVLNFDCALHAEPGSQVARKFGDDFMLQPDWTKKTVQFKRRFVFPK